MSYLGAAMCIISTAQQARPKVRGHREPCKPVIRSSQTAETHLSSPVDKIVHPGQGPLHLVLLEVYLEGGVAVGLCSG